MNGMMKIVVSGMIITFLSAGASVFAEADAKAAQPLRALLISGGGWHDYDGQLEILTDGISARANVVWTIDGEAGEAADVKLSRHKRKGWADGFDVIVYNICLSGVTDVAYVEGIARTHAETGVPAVFIHCAIHSYRAETDAWFRFGGVTSHRHGEHYPFEIVNIRPEHPIMRAFPDTWMTPKGELYLIEKVWPDATPLAHAMSRDTNKYEVCVWTNRFGKARVFGTTVGHHNETMAAKEYLDLMARGILWAAEKLGDDGKPRPGYGPVEGTWFSLFDGKTLDGWKINENRQGWKVEDGKIVAHGPRSHMFYEGPVGRADFKNFELKCEVYTYPKANSGIFFHTKYQNDGWPGHGHEAQVNATHGDPRKTGSLYGVKDVMDEAPHKDNEWFDYHIIVRGKRIIFKVNGKTVLDYTEPDDVGGTRRLSRGTIALQAHDPGSRMYYRNIRIRLLPD